MEVVAEEESLQPRHLPEFDVSFRDTLPTFYFHHIIDPIAATLRVEVLGPNLAYTFRHDRAKEQRLSASTIFTRLERKTTGFLALRTDTGKKRIVLAWAESGNGAGLLGDLLDPEPSVLPNDIWTQRVISMGKILGLGMRRPFDGRLSRVMGRDMAGVFLGGHVEAKLAVHAVFVLLDKFGITQDLENVSLRHLKGLRGARWEDGSRPAFEIYFSRKNCNFCGNFVRTLQKATGIRLKLVWRDRLVKIVYDKRPLRKINRTTNRPQPQEAIEAIDIDIDDCDTLITDITDEVHVIDLIDLSRVAEIINLTDDNSHNNINNNNSGLTISSSTPSEQGQHGRSAAGDTYIDGLAYCVGQIEQCPAGAQAAILELAQKIHQHRGAESRRAAALVNISKPLPATPQTAPPGSDIAEAWRAEPAAGNALLTPPSSGSRRDGWTNGNGTRASLDHNGTSNLRLAAPPIEERTLNLRRLELRKDRDARRAALASRSRAHRASFCVELPSRRCSSSPDPF